MQVVCGTPDPLPRALAELDRQEPIGPPSMQRTNRNAGLRHPSRAWATESWSGVPLLNPAKSSMVASPPAEF